MALAVVCSRSSQSSRFGHSPLRPEQCSRSFAGAPLARYPSFAERAAAITYLSSGDLTRKTEDLQFALLNKLEFLFN